MIRNKLLAKTEEPVDTATRQAEIGQVCLVTCRSNPDRQENVSYQEYVFDIFDQVSSNILTSFLSHRRSLD